MNLQFDFLVDKEKNSITAKREFAVEHQLVWDCYTKINPIDFQDTLDAFSDADGNINSDLPKAEGYVRFSDKGANALVQTAVTDNSLADLQAVIDMGMKEGFTSTSKKLDELLLTLNK